jgi:molybdate transport system permease protein
MNSIDWMPIFVSLKPAPVTTSLLLVFTVPLACVLAHSRFAGKSFFDALVNLRMVLPPTVMGFYLVIVMGPRGPAGQIRRHLTGGLLLFSSVNRLNEVPHEDAHGGCKETFEIL